jgi:hypothetical protein
VAPFLFFSGENLGAPSIRIASSTIRAPRRGADVPPPRIFFASLSRSRSGMNKRKRVAIAKHRAKKKKLKARLAGAK